MYKYIKYDILPCKTVPAMRWILIPEVKVALLVLLSRARTSDAKSNAELHMISTILLQFITYFNYNREDWREEYCMHHIVVQWSTIMASSLANSANASGDIFFATQSDSTLQQRGMSQNEWFSAIECNRL